MLALRGVTSKGASSRQAVSRSLSSSSVSVGSRMNSQRRCPGPPGDHGDRAGGVADLQVGGREVPGLVEDDVDDQPVVAET